MKQPVAFKLLIHIEPRNSVVRAAAHRAVSGAAGPPARSQGALRRAEKVVLQRLVRGMDRRGRD